MVPGTCPPCAADTGHKACLVSLTRFIRAYYGNGLRSGHTRVGTGQYYSVDPGAWLGVSDYLCFSMYAVNSFRFILLVAGQCFFLITAAFLRNCASP